MAIYRYFFPISIVFQKISFSLTHTFFVFSSFHPFTFKKSTLFLKKPIVTCFWYAYPTLGPIFAKVGTIAHAQLRVRLVAPSTDSLLN